MKISYYKTVKSSAPSKDIEVSKVLDLIREGEYMQLIKNVRFYIGDDVKRSEEKQKLPLVSFCGTFVTRKKEGGLNKASGLACLDFDHLHDVNLTKDMVIEDEYTMAAFISPSGDGLKVLVKIPLVDNDADYKSFYSELRKHYDKYGETDAATSDISRITYMSYDPELYTNLDSSLFADRTAHVVITAPIVYAIKVEDTNEVARRLIKWFSSTWTTGDNRNNNLFKLSSAFNTYGLPSNMALDYCMQYMSKDFGAYEISQLVNSAYKNTSSHGTKSFEDKGRINEISRLVANGQSKEDIGNKMELTDSVKNEIDRLQSEDDEGVFWNVDEKGRIQLNALRFDSYLVGKGISKYYPYEGTTDFEFVKKDDNFIDWIDTTRIKDIVKKDLIQRCESEVWCNLAMKTQLFKKDMLSMLDTVDVQPNRDTKHESFLYYKDYAIQTTKEGSKLLDYSDLNELVWSNQVINREIKLNSDSEGEFKTFVWNLSGHDAERYYTLKSVLGYLLHSYQNDAKPKAIIFNDEMLSDDVPNGGSGKGLLHKAIGHIKNIAMENGKKWDSNSQFAYQKVNKDTQIFQIDDVNKGFNFESLFSVVSEGMTIEKKGKDAYQIPFKESPKISITTNYTIKGEGSSHARRVFEVEIANHYNAENTPQDEFGHQFFSEWDTDEWGRFDNFMIRCIQYYLKNGLVESNKVNLDERKYKNELGAEFIEFMDATDWSARVSKKKFRDMFYSDYPQQQKYVTAIKFNKKVKTYCAFHNIELVEVKSNGILSFDFVKEEEPIELTEDFNEELPF